MRARRHARADVRDADKLQQALQRAVLAVRAVDEREDDVDATQGSERLGAVEDAVAERLVERLEALRADAGERLLGLDGG